MSAAPAAARGLEVRAAAPNPGLALISRLVLDYRLAKLLFVAAKLDLFTGLSGRRLTAAEIAARLEFDERAAGIFLDALAAMGLLDKREARYGNAEASERFLVRGKAGFLGDNLAYQDMIWDSWGRLEAALRRGSSVEPLDERLQGQKDFIQNYIRAMSDISGPPAREVAAALGPCGAGTMLDLGGGPGTYALTFLELNPSLRAEILDLPGTLQVAREFVEGSPHRDRVRLIEGDYHQSDLGRERYDLILISHVTHHEGDGFNQEIVRRAHAALVPGGRLAVHDFMTDDARTAPLFSAAFSAHMLVTSRQGKTYSLGDYEGWMKDAGFGELRRAAISAATPNPTELLVGRKA